MNTTTNTERPKLKLNFGAKPLALNTNGGALVVGSALKKVVVFENLKAMSKMQVIHLQHLTKKMRL